MEKGAFKMTERLFAVLTAISEIDGGTIAELRDRPPFSNYFDLRTCLDRLVDRGFLRVRLNEKGVKVYYSRNGREVPATPGQYYRPSARTRTVNDYVRDRVEALYERHKKNFNSEE